MKVEALNINEWSDMLERFKAEREPDMATPVAMRIENTMFASARYSGGMTFNGNKYTYFEPSVPGRPANPDGTPHVAWLMVREDFLRWVKRRKEVRNGNDNRP